MNRSFRILYTSFVVCRELSGGDGLLFVSTRCFFIDAKDLSYNDSHIHEHTLTSTKSTYD